MKLVFLGWWWGVASIVFLIRIFLCMGCRSSMDNYFGGINGSCASRITFHNNRGVSGDFSSRKIRFLDEHGIFLQECSR